jgi:hypothetical protein
MKGVRVPMPPQTVGMRPDMNPAAGCGPWRAGRIPGRAAKAGERHDRLRCRPVRCRKGTTRQPGGAELAIAPAASEITGSPATLGCLRCGLRARSPERHGGEAVPDRAPGGQP